MRRYFRHYFVAVMLLLACAGTTADARVDAGAAPQVRGTMMRDFIRLTFEWPQTTLFTARAEGNNVILTFDRKVRPNMGAVLSKLHPYIVKAEKKADGRTVVLTLDKPHRVRTFISDNVSGIDILDLKNGSKLPAVKEKKPQLAEKKKPEKKLAQKKKEKPAVKVASRKHDGSGEFAHLSPAAGEAAAPAAETKEEARPAEPAKEAAVPATEPKKEEPAAPVKEQAKETPKEAAPAATSETAAPVASGEIKAGENASATERGRNAGVSMVPLAVDDSSDEKTPEEPKKAEAAPATAVEASQDTGPLPPLTTNKIVVSADAEGATLRFPLKERTAMAAFVRMNVLWVVFDKKLDFDLDDFENLPQTIIGKATILEGTKGATVVRMPISDNIFPAVKQQEGQLDLAIILSPAKKVPDAAMTIVVNTDPTPANVFVPALEAGNTLEVEDPNIGDVLSITPLYTREQGIARTRNFVEFSVLSSIQGLAIAKQADATEVTVLRNGLRISLPRGAHLSPAVAMPEDEKAAALSSLPASGTLFPDDLWALEPGRTYKYTMESLFHQTVFGANEGAKNLARLRMAQLYLRNGFTVEALGMLDNIKRTNPSYYRSAKLSAMHGAANFLLYRFNDAARDFAAGELNNNPEVDYWRDMLADLLGSPSHSYDYMTMNKSYIAKYPVVFRQRLAIVAADRMIAGKEYNNALKIFDTLAKDNIIAPIQPYVDYLTAKISADNGQQAEAMEVWKRLIGDSSNKFVQARAGFSLILAEIDNNTLNRDQALDKLERLRLNWHGDGLELQVVQLLGDMYAEKKDYVNAMRVWQIGVTGFKNTGPAIDMSHKMEETFAKLFTEGFADKMTPIEALALYYEYRNYSPPGAAGSQMIEKLADRLVSVDLLTTAAQLLEQQMRTQMEKVDRSRVGAKLADIYLMNNQPKKAMKALQDSVYGDNPILQRLQRNRLTARAMAQLGRSAEALSVLGQDESVESEKLRAMIYWDEKDWPAMTASIEGIFKKRPDPSAPLDAEEGDLALRLALAYVFQNNPDQVQYMRDYFKPLMKDNPLKAAFDFVTSPDVNLTTRNFDDLLQSLSTTRSFINSYQARIALADTEPPPAEAPAPAATAQP